jgi:hypothetical protein
LEPRSSSSSKDTTATVLNEGAQRRGPGHEQYGTLGQIGVAAAKGYTRPLENKSTAQPISLFPLIFAQF